MDGADLCFEIEKRASAGFVYSEAVASHYMRQILDAIRYCHQNNIIHRDIKPHCVLLSSRENSAPIKLGGFGISIELPDDEYITSGRIGTPNYMSPEVVLRQPYGKPVDVWSCGVVLFVLLSGSLPFVGNNRRLFELVSRANLMMRKKQWDHVSETAKDLLKKMLVLDPNKRMTVEDALQHQWIRERERFAPKRHLNETVDEMKKFNARRRLKSLVLSAVSSQEWQRPIVSVETDAADDEADQDQDEMSERKLTSIFLEDQASSIAISTVLDSLEDMQYLTDYFDTDCNFLDEVFEDSRLEELLEVGGLFLKLFIKIN